MNKIQKLKEIAQELDVIPYWNENSESSTIRRIIKFQRRILENKEEEKVVKSAYKAKHLIWVLLNKTNYIEEETEKEKLNNIFEELDKLVGKEVKN
jgi:hypothetical protein